MIRTLTRDATDGRRADSRTVADPSPRVPPRDWWLLVMFGLAVTAVSTLTLTVALLLFG